MRDSRSYGPDPVHIHRHRHFIFNIWSFGYTTELGQNEFPNLKTLALQDIYDSKSPERIANMSLMEMCPSLTGLSLNTVDLSTLSWRSLSTHHHIKEMSLYRIKVKTEDTPAFWETCTKLESLTLMLVTIEGTGVPSHMAFTRIRELMVSDIKQLNAHGQMNLILRCPNLENLSWFTTGWEQDLSLDQCMQHGRWPHLRRLSVGDLILDSHFATILEGIGEDHGGLVRLECVDTISQGRTSIALRRHFDTLAYLNIESCTESMGPTIQDILCSCTRLEELITGSVLAKDVAEGGPWACQLLRRLKTCFWFKDSEQDMQQLVFEHLSTLTRLERLTLDGYIPTGEYNTLKFRLDCGLGQLINFQLEILKFGKYYETGMGVEEVEWIVTNWKKLKRIYGKLNDDPAVEVIQATALQSHGIDHRSCHW